MVKNFFKITFRNLRKHKTYSFLNIFGLAMGIACAGLIFLWAENELTWDNNNVKKARLFQVQINMLSDGNNFTMGSTPRPMGKAMMAELPGIINTARMSDGDMRLLFTVDGKSMYSVGRYGDAPLFNMFSFDFIEGNPRNPYPQLYSLVISESARRKFFGRENAVVGKTIRIDNRQDYVVSAVVKDMPGNATLQFEWLAPYDVLDKEGRAMGSTDYRDWGSYGPFTFAELSSRANLKAINQQLKTFIHHKSADQKSESFLFPMPQWHLYNEFANGKQTGGGAITQVRLLSVIAAILFLIGCINFMNLATANSQTRAREIGVRKVLGSGKKNLVLQFIGESIFMSFLAGIVAIIIISWSLPAFNSLMQKRLSLQLENPVHWVGLLLIIISCGLIAGSYPSVYLSSFNPVFVLKGTKMKAGGAAVIRKGLVVFQFAVSIVFIIGTIVAYLQIEHVKNRNLGFDRNNLIQIDPQNDVSRIFPLIKEGLMSTGVVQDVALADHAILDGGDTDNGFKWEGKSPNNGVSIAHRNVSREFISASGMKIIEGKDFSENSSSVNTQVIINQAMAKMMGKDRAVGKIIQSPRSNKDGVFTNMTVVGVVQDYVYGNAYEGNASPLVIFCRPPEYQNFLYVKIKDQRVEQALSKIKEVMKKDNPAYPLEYQFVDDRFRQMFATETQISQVSGLFAVLAITISCLGLFGLATFTAERRIKEIGIRKVLGASVTGITALLSVDFLQLVGIACLIAFPVAWWIMHNWLQHFDYRIDIGWWIFLSAGLLAVFIALVTISFQSIKAAVANPVRSLRTE